MAYRRRLSKSKYLFELVIEPDYTWESCQVYSGSTCGSFCTPMSCRNPSSTKHSPTLCAHQYHSFSLLRSKWIKPAKSFDRKSQSFVHAQIGISDGFQDRKFRVLCVRLCDHSLRLPSTWYDEQEVIFRIWFLHRATSPVFINWFHLVRCCMFWSKQEIFRRLIQIWPGITMGQWECSSICLQCKRRMNPNEDART
jgi:hypothetical protein